MGVRDLILRVFALCAKHMILPEEVGRGLGKGDYVAQDVQLPADAAESKKFGLLYDLIQVVVFPVPQCPIQNGLMVGIAAMVRQRQLNIRLLPSSGIRQALSRDPLPSFFDWNCQIRLDGKPWI